MKMQARDLLFRGRTGICSIFLGLSGESVLLGKEGQPQAPGEVSFAWLREGSLLVKQQ